MLCPRMWCHFYISLPVSVNKPRDLSMYGLTILPGSVMWFALNTIWFPPLILTYWLEMDQICIVALVSTACKAPFVLIM